MLLSLMRKHAKSWIIKVLIAMIIMVFIFFFGYSYISNEGEKVAEVNGEAISYVEYQNAYRELLKNLQEQYKNMWSDNLIETFDLKNRALESLIENKIIAREAENIGLDITDKEIREKIMAYTAFQDGGIFDENRYRAVLANNRTGPEDFEEAISQELLHEKLIQFLQTFLIVNDQEVLDQYTYYNQRVKIGFVRFPKMDYMDSVKIDQGLMIKYFEEHREGYRIPEKVKIAYIAFDPRDFRDQVKLDDQEIEYYYEDNQDQFTRERQINARHILFSVPSDASAEQEEKVKEKALSVLEKAREGQDFSELAKKYSEDMYTKDQGGDLGYFQKGLMPEAFEKAAFNMEKGQTSDLVKTPYGYHIIKVEDTREESIKDLKEVRDQISDILISNASTDLANEKALSIMDQMPYDVDLAQFASKHNVNVIKTDYFSQDEPIPYIEGDAKLRQSIFSLQKTEISELIEFNNIFYIIQAVDKKPSYLPEMTEVSDKLKTDYAAYLAAREAKSAAERYLAKLREGTDWGELAKTMNIIPEITDFFTRRDSLEMIGVTPGLNDAAFKLSENNRYPDAVLENEDGALVIRWEAGEGIDKDKYRQDKSQYADSLMLLKRLSLYDTWLKRLKDQADIDRSKFEKYK
jgi:peptidyl-prolyl cis-trans isomerase D